MLALAADALPVRLAQPSDEDDLMVMLHMMHREAGLHRAPICEESVRATVQRAIIPSRNDPNAGMSCCGIIGQPGRLEASICLGVTKPWWSGHSHIGDFWNFVSPEYRKTTHARTLIAFAKVVAETVQMELQLGVVSLERTAAKERFFERNGFQRIGGYFRYNPEIGA